MAARVRTLQRRIEALRERVGMLSTLRRLVDLPAGHDLTDAQWARIESGLGGAQGSLAARLGAADRAYLPRADGATAARTLHALLGEIELDLARAFVFFDTYVDILSQRRLAGLGPLLAGCDVLAWDAIARDHPALAGTGRPLVHCDRGFGASTMREGVPFPDGAANPLPLIQIPYSRLAEKYNLTSVLHEVGHTAMVRLGLVSTLPEALRSALGRAGASDDVQRYYALWAFEIGPDFWTFCAAGPAAAGGIREILALPPAHAFHVSWTDPHPPPYLRVLLAFECCRQAWGRGIWDRWETEWRELHTPPAGRLLTEAAAHLGVVAGTLLHTRFRTLGGRAIRDLFDLSALAPPALEPAAQRVAAGRPPPRGLSPSAQLAAFRMVKERGDLDERRLDARMTAWLRGLGTASKREGGTTNARATAPVRG
jgi:hypothetical protein